MISRRLCAVAIALAGCQSVPPSASTSLVVKQQLVNGVHLAYVEEGKGDTVVFVHGACGDWRNWEAVRPFISAEYHFVALSRRYHAPNHWTDDGGKYTMDQHVEDLAEFIRALAVGKVHLVGGSWGGRLVAVLALRHPALVRSVVMSDPAGLSASTTDEGMAAAAAYAKEISESRAAALRGDAREAAVVLFNAVEGDPNAFQAAASDRQQAFLDNARTLAPMYSAPPSRAVRCDELGAIKVPAMVIRGEHTRAHFRFGDEAALACLPPGTTSAVIPGATHIWYPVAPQQGAKAILQFFAAH